MAKSLPPVSAKLVADAEQFIAEFRRAERQAQGTTGRVGNEVDKMAKSLSKKFSLSDIGKSMLGGLGLGSGFAIVDTIFSKIGQAVEQHEQELKAIDDTWKRIVEKSTAYQRSLLSPEKNIAAMEGDLATLQKQYQELTKLKDFNFTSFNPATGQGSTVTLTRPDDGNKNVLAIVKNLEAQQEVMQKIEEARKKQADEGHKSSEQAKRDLEEISKLHTQTWAAMEKNYQAMLADLPEEAFDQRRDAIEDMFYSGKIGAEAASKAIKELDADQARWTDNTTRAAMEHMKVWSDVFETLNDGGMTEAMENNRQYAEEMKDSMVYFADGVESFLDDAIARGKDFGDVIADLGNSIISTFLKLAVINPLMNGIFGGAKGWEALPTLFGFADGGRPPVGRASIVGERGPELFVPDTAGTVVPNHALQGGGTSNTYYIDARGADRTGLARLEAMIRELNGTVEQRALGAVMDYRRRGAAA